MDKRYLICISIIAFLHGAGIFFFQFQKEIQERRARQIYGVEYREEQEKKKLPTPKTPTIGVKEKLKSMFEKKEKLQDKISDEDLRKLAKIARPLEVAQPDQKIDIAKMLELHKTQVAMDMDQYEKLDIGEAGEIEVIRVGTGKSTQEILQEDKIVLPKAATLKGKIGLFTTPGVGVSGSGDKEAIKLETVKAEDIRKEKEAFKRAFSESKKTQTLKAAPIKKPKPKTEVQISGALKDRKALKSPLPHYPDWALTQGISAILQLQLKVGPNGKIKGRIIVLTTTGYPEWDNAVKNWLKNKWKWKTLPITTSGIISFRFILG
ncbi:energy transducer TonB [candidate division WOR-3 bacterium]|nr:energy transducer TonB [candidate division WOR-3 bacterium]